MGWGRGDWEADCWEVVEREEEAEVAERAGGEAG